MPTRPNRSSGAFAGLLPCVAPARSLRAQQRDGDQLEEAHSGHTHPGTTVPSGVGADAPESKEVDDLRVALRVMAEQVVASRLAVEQRVRSNVEQLLSPLLVRLREQSAAPARATIDQLEAALAELTSSFAATLLSGDFRLTSRELQICHMVRAGKSSKEVAQVLSLSPQSVDVHRKNIRRKLGLRGAECRLTAALRELEGGSVENE